MIEVTPKAPINPRQEVSITRDPAVNLLSQEKFRERAEQVLSIMDEILGRSYGPYGAATLISDYPYVHATKDGFTIARQITFDHIAGSPIDRVIARMAMDICGRLNYAVGDGTTTAILATNQMFNEVREQLPKGISPRELIAIIQRVKDLIIEKLQKDVTPVTPENIADVIRKITLVSSNGDEDISNMITEVYEKYNYPILRCDVADGVDTYLDIVEGFKCKVRLGDALYINNSRKTGEYMKPYVLIFDHQLKVSTYTNIISPLYSMCRQLGRTLLIVAPSYDDVVLNNHIRRDVMAEYRSEKRASLVITSYPKNNKSDAAAIYDLAMLTDTTVIDRAIEEEIIDAAYNTNDKLPGASRLAMYIIKVPSATTRPDDSDGNYIMKLGRADKFIGAEKESIFYVSEYDDTLYQKCLADAKNVLDQTTKKFEILGTYTADVYDAQYRYVSLLMKTAVIYVGGDSTLSRDMRADSVEDAIRAAESAFQNGYVLGGNISLIRAIREVLFFTHDVTDIEKGIAKAFLNAFQNVYRRVFDNCPKITSEPAPIEVIVDACCEMNKVYDVVTDTYSSDIINSVKTDEEVLTATVDLLSILLTGNQVLVTRYQHEPQEG